ncbi:MAG: OadG family protein [Fretibacterium sp.]|nr:OadG family protein [Fretibacterium sp.]
MHFEGISGAVNVSIVAFSIVFGVLLILTATIYAMKLFAGSGDKPAAPAGKAPSAPAKAAAPAAPAAAPVQASGSAQAKIVAAITAAVLAMTGGRGRILSIQPAVSGGCGRSFSTWRASGVMALVNNRLTRPWSKQ